MEISLPATASRNVMYFDDQAGRDQVANMAKGDWSAFEAPLPAILHACARSFPGLVIDVGANTGYYALLAALSRNTVRVLAFEPDPAVLGSLVANIALNHLRNRIRVSDMALSDRCGPANLYVPTQEHGLVETSSSLEAGFKPAHSEIHSIRAATLDRFLARLRYRFSRVGIMKIDVEGHEAAVLRGAKQVVRRWRPVIFIEVLNAADTFFLSNFIAEHRYTDFPLSTGGLVECQTVSFQQEAWNHALVPREKLGQFRSAIAKQGSTSF